jgi:Rrf2 family transcriptional regulator, nitric oxide-sensitive transcriptional repressor
MQLTYFSDYSMRLVLYLALHQDRVVSIQEVSRAYHVSPHHMVKVVKRLIGHEIVASVRGRRGGLRLNRPPEDIRIGELVRLTEPHLDIVECFDVEHNTCPIEPVCGLKGALAEARGAFLKVLDERTVADFLPRGAELIQLWTPSQRGPRKRTQS